MPARAVDALLNELAIYCVGEFSIRQARTSGNDEENGNALELGGITFLVSLNPSPSLVIRGVEVTVWPDAISSMDARNGETRIGEVFIRCTIGAGGDPAENRRAEANGHLATLAHMHAAQFLANRGTPHSPTSMVIDVSRELVVRGPVSTTRRVANIEAACAMIAAFWPTV